MSSISSPFNDSLSEADASSIDDLLTAPEGETDDSQAEGSEEEEDSEEIPSDPEAQKEALLALTFRERPNVIDARRRLWDKDLEGIVNPNDGKVIIAPPRPPEGGEKTKDLITTTGLFGFESPVGSKKVTEAEYWDATYGDTHDPSTGLPLNMEKLLNPDPRLVR